MIFAFRSILVAFLALAFTAGELSAKFIPENVTVTSQDQSQVDVTKNVPFAVGDDGKDHRLAVDNTGALKVVAGSAGSLTVSALAPFYVPVSSTTRTITTGAISINVTEVAQASVCQICIGGLGPSAGYWYDFAPSATTDVYGNYFAVSTTPICIRDVGPGFYMNITPTAAAATVTVKVNVFKRLPQ